MMIDVKKLANVKQEEVLFNAEVVERLHEIISAHRQDVEKNLMLERAFFLEQVLSDERLKKCTPLSIFMCFAKVMQLNLSFNPQLKHIYLIPYADTLTVEVSAYGAAAMKIQAGVISYYDDPVLVYDCDEFSIENQQVTHKIAIPDDSAKIVASYIRLYRCDKSVNTVVFTRRDFLDWMNKAIEKNTRYCKNEEDKKRVRDLIIERYKQPGFVKAKTLKHAISRIAITTTNKYYMNEQVQQVLKDATATDVEDTIDAEIF